MPCPKNTNLAEFIANQVAQNDAFTLLQSLAIWLRQRKGKFAPERMALLIDTLEKHPELCTQIAELLGKWLGSMRLYPLLISAGIFRAKAFAANWGRGYTNISTLPTKTQMICVMCLRCCLCKHEIRVGFMRLSRKCGRVCFI